MKKIKRLFVISLLVLPLVACQTETVSSSIDKLTPHSVAKNYLFVHGMCVGYLQNPFVTKEQFIALAQLDQQTKLAVLKSLIKPNAVNLEQAQYSMEEVIAFITSNQ